MMLFGNIPIKPVNRIISVTEGKIEGIPASNPAYTIFRGVPYAKPPVGVHRWAPAAAPDKWDGIRKCNTFPPVSIQGEQMEGSFYQKEFYPDVVPMSEDCLYLNIWTPDTTGTKKLPILFYIHGGAFINGFSWEMEFDGEAMCRRDCVLVTVGYRLGALGFFSHPELSKKSSNGISGNYAISDCLQALKWIKGNAAAFGGDADNITIFGQSAGGAMVQSLITCPPAKGLFKRAIVQSAGGISTLGSGFTLDKLEQIGIDVCKNLGKTLEELMAMEAIEVSRAIMKALNDILGFGLYMIPCVDGYYQPKMAGEAIAAGEHLDVDIMTGSVSGDGGLFAGPPSKSVVEFEATMRSTYKDLSNEYLKLYNIKSEEDLSAIYDVRTNIHSMLSPRSWALAEIKNNRNPLYIYYFDRKMPGDNVGAYHSSELWYIFGTIDRSWRSMASEFCTGDYTLARAMTDYWCNFARTGNPNGNTVTEWVPFTNETPVTLHLDQKQIYNRDMSDVYLLDEHVKLQHLQYMVYDNN